ncbi:hypothetical protein PR048_015718 [Dryococelus australis]|uniref:Uncharacterized protein n=1 Tax=Dryococelus australis TaxID=614101 RepID=A0ABQ9HHR9_9NEOP|nr:hypothetical protein PR048_015718 [Dryococelus australis]
MVVARKGVRFWTWVPVEKIVCLFPSTSPRSLQGEFPSSLYIPKLASRCATCTYGTFSGGHRRLRYTEAVYHYIYNAKHAQRSSSDPFSQAYQCTSYVILLPALLTHKLHEARSTNASRADVTVEGKCQKRADLEVSIGGDQGAKMECVYEVDFAAFQKVARWQSCCLPEYSQKTPVREFDCVNANDIITEGKTTAEGAKSYTEKANGTGVSCGDRLYAGHYKIREDPTSPICCLCVCGHGRLFCVNTLCPHDEPVTFAFVVCNLLMHRTNETLVIFGRIMEAMRHIRVCFEHTPTEINHIKEKFHSKNEEVNERVGAAVHHVRVGISLDGPLLTQPCVNEDFPGTETLHATSNRQIFHKKYGVAVLKTRPFVLREYIFIDALGRLGIQKEILTDNASAFVGMARKEAMAHKGMTEQFQMHSPVIDRDDVKTVDNILAERYVTRKNVDVLIMECTRASSWLGGDGTRETEIGSWGSGGGSGSASVPRMPQEELRWEIWRAASVKLTYEIVHYVSSVPTCKLNEHIHDLVLRGCWTLKNNLVSNLLPQPHRYGQLCEGGVAAVAEWLARSPPTKANRVHSPAGSPDFRMWEPCRTIPLVGGFSRGSPVSLVLSFRRCSILTSITLTGSQDIAVQSRPNLFTHSYAGGIHNVRTKLTIVLLLHTTPDTTLYFTAFIIGRSSTNGDQS